MMLRPIYAVVAAAISIVAAVSNARAEDFNFTVPVAVTNIPPAIDSGEVQCKAIVLNGGTVIEVGAGNSAPFSIIGGAFNGTTHVAFNATPGYTPSMATTWTCSIFLRVRRADGPTNYWNAGDLLHAPAPPEGRLLSEEPDGGYLPGHAP